MKKVLLWLYQPYKYLILLPIFIAETLFFTIWAWLFSFFSEKLSGKAAIAWAKIMQWLTPMPTEVVGEENIDKKQSYVVICNHQSAYDIMAIYGSLPIDFRWIMKKELRNVPALGFACEKCGHIFIDRSSARAAYRTLQEAKKVLVDGKSVVIFPEGTRSGTREMHAFKHGAFKMALDLGLPILPVSIKDTHIVMSKGLASLRPGRVRLTIHKPFEITEADYNREELEHHIEQLQATIASAL
ncbi:MAG: 1-acyl-sn-glycerol-3-phosphate acyltransferase [Bacteroidales bacterium]|jgi:1-acyl-sn-glycerol-3-phosphate acyltransferase|nr:1-acyl-sn-glycerol-3-phosphate acyltransferase [Bacteroidales bacterium]